MKSNNTHKIRQDKDNSCAVILAIFACKIREAIISLLTEDAAPLRRSSLTEQSRCKVPTLRETR